MFEQLLILASGLSALASPSRIAFVLAGILAIAGMVAIWPRRQHPVSTATLESTCSLDRSASGSPAEAQWIRLATLIETAVCRADDAGRAHEAAGNTLHALEHDLGLLRSDLAEIDDAAEISGASLPRPATASDVALATAA